MKSAPTNIQETRLDHSEKIDIIRVVLLLLNTLNERKNRQLNSIFTKQGLMELIQCYKALRLALSFGIDMEFEETLTQHFLIFLTCISPDKAEVRDELISLQVVMKSLMDISTVGAAGYLGKEGYEVAAKIQEIITWLRTAEQALISIKQRSRPYG